MDETRFTLADIFFRLLYVAACCAEKQMDKAEASLREVFSPFRPFRRAAQ